VHEDGPPKRQKWSLEIMANVSVFCISLQIGRPVLLSVEFWECISLCPVDFDVKKVNNIRDQAHLPLYWRYLIQLSAVDFG
jgi:hypothetical protein